MVEGLNGPGADGALAGLRIIDLTGPEGQNTGRYLADLGADVVLVEPTDGSASRRMAPFADRGPDVDRSLYFLHANSNKRGIVLDLESAADQDSLRKLVRGADAVLESFPNGYLESLDLDYESLSANDRRLVMTSITPFGRSGPYKDFRSADIVVNAIAGLIHQEGAPEPAPFNPPRYQAYQLGGLHAAFATLIALRERDKTGAGQAVEVSLQEVAAHQNLALVRFASSQDIGARRPNRGGVGPSQYYRTKDGWAMLALTGPRSWPELTAWTQDPVLMDPKYEILSNREPDHDLIDERCAAFVARFTTEEFLAEGSRRRITVAPAHGPTRFKESEHARERGYFIDAEHPTLGKYVAPGAGAVFSETPWQLHRSAPTLGQHSDEILSNVPQERSPTRQPAGVSGGSNGDGPALPLDGVRILAFERVWAAPFGTRFLADYGADVIKVESTQFNDGRIWDRDRNPAAWLNGHATYGEINRNKRSVSLDLHTESGQQLFLRLAAEADIVVENNAPTAMDRFGIGYEALRAGKPDIIMISCPGYGSSGPMKDYVAVGQCLTAFTGLGYLWGEAGSEWPLRGKNAYPDFITAGNLALAAMAALRHRDRTGQGQRVELAQFQAAAGMVGMAFLEDSLAPSAPEPWGNRDPNAAPQGIYACWGDDRWVAISCPDDASWGALATLMGRGDLAGDAKFATLDSRHENHDELDRMISGWTATLTPHQVMYRCQRSGVPAGVVANGEDLYRDPQLRTRGYILDVDHSVPGRVEHPGMTARFSRTPGRVRRGAPKPGEDNQELLSGLLGLSKEEIARYASEGAFS
ncbi:MAG: CoA transferase [Dehalococcoidia bacterium]|nr:CoA transferase [Dehalococcoidia bacterium]